MSNSIKAYLEVAQLIRAAFDEGFTEGAEYYRSPEVEQEAWAQSLAKEAFDALKAVTSAVVPDDSKHHAVMQAQMWAQEARTQKAIVKQIGEIVGCANDWEMVEAVKAELASAVVPECAACVSPAPHYETQRGLSCKNDTQSAVVTKDRILVPRSLIERWANVDAFNVPRGAAMELKVTAQMMLSTQQQPSAVVPSGVWQFYQDGEWHTGINNIHHRVNTEAAGYKVRDLWATQDQDPLN
jgi:hypothetical protein